MQFVGSAYLNSLESVEDLTIIATKSIDFGTDARVGAWPQMCLFIKIDLIQ
jgi:hypothetical protein